MWSSAGSAGSAVQTLTRLAAALRRQIHGDGTCEVQLGHTRALAVATGELVRPGAAAAPRALVAAVTRLPAQSPPFRDRPSEGIFAVNVELGPMASPEYEAGGRPPDEAVELARVLERGLKQSGACHQAAALRGSVVTSRGAAGAVDTESLVVQAGRWVWSVRLDVHILDHGGNVAGAASLAVRLRRASCRSVKHLTAAWLFPVQALAALLTFRRSEVTVSPETGQLDVHPEEQREPLALSLHHLPVLLTFAFYDSAGELVVLDPTADEERAAKGVMTVRERCGRGCTAGRARCRLAAQPVRRCARR